MSSIPSAIGHSVIGVAWRLAVGLAVLLCFLGLSSLREWHSHYAPSDAWAGEVAERQDLEWAPVVKAAVETMPMPQKPYTDKKTFYKSFLKHLRKPKVEISKNKGIKQKLTDYRQDLARKEEYLSKFKAKITQLEEEFASQSEELKTLASNIAKARGANDKKLDELLQQRTAIREDIRGLSIDRSLIKAGFQEQLADLEDRIESSEEGIREAFDAAPPSARPVNGAIANIIGKKFAIQIGDETHPLHIVYLVLWYGLEAFIAFLVCLVFVPWVLSLGGLVGSTPDPKSVQGNTTTWIKGRLSEVFGPRGVTNAAKAVAAVAATGLTVAGVALAAGTQPPVSPPPWHESESIVGTKGEKGEPGRPGNPARDGTDGEDAVLPPELQEALEEQTRQIKAQAVLIEGLQASVEKLSRGNNHDDGGNSDGDKDTTGNPVTKDDLANLATREDLTKGVGDLNNGMATVNKGVGVLTFTNGSMMSSLERSDLTFMTSLDLISGTAWKAASDVQQVKTDVAKAEDVPPIAADLLRINAIPNGVLHRINPFARYKVTKEVIETMERATRYDKGPEVQTVLNALRQVQGQKMDAGQLRLILLNYTAVKSDPAAYALLDRKLMPLILKLSRL